MKTIEKRIVVFLLLFLGASLGLSAYTIRQLTNADGLTNSAVLSLSQTPDGFMWFGTCDGLSLYDGTTIRPFGINPEDELCGNLIEAIVTADNNDMWVMTNYGVTYLRDNQREIISFPEFKRATIIRKNNDDIVFVVSQSKRIFYNEKTEREKFAEIDAVNLPNAKLLDLVPFRDFIYLICEDKITKYRLERNPEGNLKMTKAKEIKIRLKNSFNDDGDIFLLTEDNKLCIFELRSESVTPLIELEEYIARRGDISDVSYSRDNSLFVSFKNNGVLKFNDNGNGYSAEDIGIRGGIFTIKRDRFQDVIWIGSDGNGVFVYANDAYSLKMITYPQIANSVVSPVRSLLPDDDNSLWIGTKGDGIVRIKDFDPNKSPILYEFEKITTQNSDLPDNSVYALGKSRRPLLWIGSENGLNYFDKTKRKVCKLTTPESVKYIHSIYEESDSVLWLASVGNGILKVKLGGKAESPVVKDVRRYVIDNGFFNSNFFFTISRGANGEMLFGNRGSGVFKLSNDSLQPIPLHNKYSSNIVNDAFAIQSSNDTLWIGTGAGLVMQNGDEERLFGSQDGFPKSAIHTLERDQTGNLWIATNKGLVHLDVKTGRTQSYSHLNGLDLTEFSDGASTVTSDMILFGGINGVAVIKASPAHKTAGTYTPDIYFTQLSINGHEVHMADYQKNAGSEKQLVFSPTENNLKFSFAAPDHINGGNYVYYYRFGDEKEWTRSEKYNSVTFTNMPYGTYSMDVKYYNPVNDIESDVYTLKFRIRTPWYLSIYAKITYIICIVAMTYLLARRYRQRIRERQNHILKEMERTHKEEIYEEKLRFFTNITHELCTPLTLMYGPCERILNYSNSDNYINKYVRLIKNNTERLNALIQEVIDFRRMETGHKKLNITRIDISQVCHDVAASFADLAEQNKVNFETDIQHDLVWNVDRSGLNKILYNLVSNAFKYTSDDGTIRLAASIKDERLILSVYNTGKGISPENCKKVFNRYAVLDSVEENATKGLSARNGLGLAICHSIVKLHGGTISIDSKVGKYAMFIVSLPMMEVTSVENNPGAMAENINPNTATLPPVTGDGHTNMGGGESDPKQLLSVIAKVNLS